VRRDAAEAVPSDNHFRDLSEEGQGVAEYDSARMIGLVVPQPPGRSAMWLVGLIAVALVVAGCGKGPAGPSEGPPAVTPLTLTPPADIRIDNVMTSSVTVTYTLPTASGGVPPVTVSCAPASGTTFPVGTTVVHCNGSDGVRNAVCQFSVTITAFVPVLSVNSFLALGDSITAGENGLDAPDVDCAPLPNVVRPRFIDLCRSYPSVLQGMLRDRYSSQTSTVINVGERGQPSGDGLSLLPGYMTSFRPDAVLVFEGINDLPNNGGVIIPNLRGIIQTARNFGAKEVFVSTLLPCKPGFRCSSETNAQVPTINNQIRALVSEQRAVLVDNGGSFFAMGDYSSLLENDGEHPSPAGYRLIAQNYFSAIRTRFEGANAAAALARFRR